ncbi:L-2-hydroxyglutarate oxidase [Planctomycetota bacterium]
MGRQVDFDVVVIGGGIVGLACAYKIAKNHPDIDIAVVEKEDKLAAHQTGHNSGVIHSGLYYQPGSNKVKTCVEGRKELVAFAKKYKLPYKICGKIIVAARKKELKNLELIFRNGLENAIEGIEKISPEQIEEIEPFCRGIAGIKVPCTGVIDFASVAEKLAELIQELSGSNKILLSNKVLRLEKHDFLTTVVTDKMSLKSRFIINCAGLQSDRIAKLDEVESKIKIVPFRGDYYELTDEAAEKVNNLIYPVPDANIPFLGVHLTRGIDGRVECGPNAMFSFSREGYCNRRFSFNDTRQSLTFSGTWKLFLRNFGCGVCECASTLSKELFLWRLQRIIPSLRGSDIKPGKTGIRAQAVDSAGRLIDDFEIQKNGNCIHILNAPSPAATASLAIAEYINQTATEYFELKV